MSQTRVEKHEAIKVWIIWSKVLRFVHGVVVFHESRNFHGVRHPVLDDGAKGIGCCSFWEWKLVVSVLHTLRANHDDMKLHPRKYMGKLEPDISG